MGEYLWLGYLAAALTTSSVLPQAVKSFRTKRTDELSLPFLLIMLAGLLIWLAYGLLTSEPALIASNSLSSCLVGSLVAMKLRYG
jgi:MtN3 and saliva related transmembrane protein